MDKLFVIAGLFIIIAGVSHFLGIPVMALLSGMLDFAVFAVSSI